VIAEAATSLTPSEAPESARSDRGRSDRGRSERPAPERTASERAPPERASRDRITRYGGEPRTGGEPARDSREPRDHERVGFGSDVPAFLLRATPLPPLAKAEEALEVEA
jgi:hypothetical protein